jgi:sialate O-acetylesterase
MSGEAMLIKGLYTNGVVFSKNYPLTFIGTYEDKAQVRIEIYQEGNRLYDDIHEVSKEGKLFVKTIKLKASYKEVRVKVTTKNTTESFVGYVGEVYLGAGQSNMAYALKYDNHFDEVMSQAEALKGIRCLKISDSVVQDEVIKRPLDPLTHFLDVSGWVDSSDASFSDFSGLLLMLGLLHQQKKNYPIGLIDVSVPGCSIEGFLPIEAIENTPGIKSYLEQNGLLKYPLSQVNDYTMASGIYNEKIAPMAGFPIDQFLWYQGEHHVGSNHEYSYYKEALKTLIESYRSLFQQQVPVILIYINQTYYPQDDNQSVSRINLAIQETQSIEEQVYAIPTYDVIPTWKNSHTNGIENPIHPTNKFYIAKRIHQVIHKIQRPVLVSEVRILTHAIEITYDQDLKQGHDLIEGFTIAGDDGIYQPAEAKLIKPNTIVLSSRFVDHPVYFTYAFQLDNHLFSLKSKKGMPLPIQVSDNNLTKGHYYTYYGYEHFSHLEYFETAFDPLYGTPRIKPLLFFGELHHNSDIKIFKGKHHIHVHYQPKTYLNSKERFGISVDLSKTGFKLMFSRFRKIEFRAVYESINEVTFIGVLFKDVKNQVWLVKPTSHDFIDNQEVYDLDLTKTSYADLSIKTIELNRYDQIKHMELVFEVRENTVIELVSMTHHQ